MNKNILATICLLFGLTLLLPMTVSAAFNDVQFTEYTDVYLTGEVLTLTIAGGGIVGAMTANAGNISFDMLSGSTVTVRSADRKILTADPAIAVGTCGTSFYSITLQSASTQTVTVTPGSTCVTIVSPGGGGGAAVPIIPTMPTTTTGSVTATASGGGATSITSTGGGGAAVEVPVGAVSSNTTVVVTPVGTAESMTGNPPAGSFMVGGYVYQFSATSGGAAVTTFSEAVTLTFTYTNDQIANIDESTLVIYYWNSDTSAWVALSSTVNAATNTVTATTTHFSYFTIMGGPATAVTTISGMTIAEMQAKIVEILAQIKVLQAQLAALIGGTVVTGVPADFSFDSALELGDSKDAVQYLQIVLNSDADTQLTASGVGSSGNETVFFGSLTKAAVIKFQNKYASEVLTPWNLTKGTGFVGSTTRDKLNALLGK